MSFSQLPAVEKDTEKWAAGKFLGPSYFEATLALKLLLGFSQQLQKRLQSQMFSTPCWSVTSLRLFFLKYAYWSEGASKNPKYVPM